MTFWLSSFVKILFLSPESACLKYIKCNELWGKELSAYLKTRPFFFLPGVSDVGLNLHWCSLFFPEAIDSFTSIGWRHTGVTMAASQVDTACWRRELTRWMYGKTCLERYMTQCIVYYIISYIVKDVHIYIFTHLCVDQKLIQCS